MKKPFRQKRLKIPTPESLGNAALAYLARMAASEASLRRVLENRLRRAQRLDTAFAADAAKQTILRSAIDTIIEKHRRLGTLNDAVYAESRVSSLRRAGRSRRFIQQAMNLKGIDAALTNDALSVSDDGREPGEAERLGRARFRQAPPPRPVPHRQNG